MAAVERRGRADESVASDVAAVIDLLQKVVRGRRLDPGLEGIDVHIGEEGPGVILCEVDIRGDSKADRTKIKKKFKTSEGWTCKDTSTTGPPWTATCTNP